MYPLKLIDQLYRMMVRIRLCEESLIAPIEKKEIKGPVHLYTGEEAIATGVCASLKDSDLIFGNHRSHGHYLAKGGDLKQLISEIYGKETGCSRGRGGSMHLTFPEKGFMGSVPIIAATVPLAMGAAFSLKKNKGVAVAFFGDGALSEGVIYESMNFASLKKIPLLLACENNFYATHMKLKDMRLKDNIFESGKAFGIPCLKIDGNDVFKVYQVVGKVVSKMRKGKGPFFIEFRTYRLRGHVGPDDNIQGEHRDIRPKREIENWKKKDPIEKMEKFLLGKKIFSQEEMDSIKQSIQKEIEEAHEFARNSSFPKENSLTDYVFK